MRGENGGCERSAPVVWTWWQAAWFAFMLMWIALSLAIGQRVFACIFGVAYLWAALLGAALLSGCSCRRCAPEIWDGVPQ